MVSSNMVIFVGQKRNNPSGVTSDSQMGMEGGPVLDSLKGTSEMPHDNMKCFSTPLGREMRRLKGLYGGGVLNE